MANTTKRTRPLTHLDNKPRERNYGPMATKPSSSKKKTTKKGK